jgi:hypothetical protein
MNNEIRNLRGKARRALSSEVSGSVMRRVLDSLKNASTPAAEMQRQAIEEDSDRSESSS